MQFTLTDERLNQLAGMINKIPTEFGCPLLLTLNQWHNEAIAAAAQKEAPAGDAQPEPETPTT